MDLVNAERQSRGLPAYAVDNRLRAAARVQAADMACNHFTGHIGSDGSTVGDRVTLQGYDWQQVTENFYATGNTGSDAPQDAFDWWMNSTIHRNNLLNTTYTEFAIGYIYWEDSDYGGYFVAVFALPD